jgi:bacterioferritin-associated ferredoxin
MPIDENILVVSFPETDGPSSPKASSIAGEYTRTEPGCFRKEGGGKISFLGGYWYIGDRLGQQVAWVEGGANTVPETDWQTRGDGIFGSWENIPIVVAQKFIDVPETALAKVESMVGCSSGCGECWASLKEKIPHEHRQTVERYQQDFQEKHLTIVREQAVRHSQSARDKFDEYGPVVKQKSREAYTACYDFWTHPDTVDAMKKAVKTTADALKYCIAGCLAMTAGLVDQAVGSAKVEVTENDQAMDASYIKLDSVSPVLVEPATLPPQESNATS